MDNMWRLREPSHNQRKLIPRLPPRKKKQDWAMHKSPINRCFPRISCTSFPMNRLVSTTTQQRPVVKHKRARTRRQGDLLIWVPRKAPSDCEKPTGVPLMARRCSRWNIEDPWWDSCPLWCSTCFMGIKNPGQPPDQRESTAADLALPKKTRIVSRVYGIV